MSLFDGVVSFDDTDVPVIIGLQDDGLRMSSGGAEIGQWGEGEFSINPAGDGTYDITAENETLRFVPSNPSLFAAGVGVAVAPPPPSPKVDETPVVVTPTRAAASGELDNGVAPAPRTITLVAFYSLAVATAGLGLWALVSLFL